MRLPQTSAWATRLHYPLSLSAITGVNPDMCHRTGLKIYMGHQTSWRADLCLVSGWLVCHLELPHCFLLNNSTTLSACNRYFSGRKPGEICAELIDLAGRPADWPNKNISGLITDN